MMHCKSETSRLLVWFVSAFVAVIVLGWLTGSDLYRSFVYASFFAMAATVGIACVEHPQK
jgi:hypothetical protein